MLKATHTKHSPWTLVDFNDQKRGRRTLIRDLLDRLPDTKVPPARVQLPSLDGKPLKERYGVLKPIPPLEVSRYARHWTQAGLASRSEEHTSELQSLMRSASGNLCLT